MKAEVVSIDHARQTDELELLVLNIEQARDEALAGDYQFLAYLLGMARIEAATILDSQQRRKR